MLPLLLSAWPVTRRRGGVGGVPEVVLHARHEAMQLGGEVVLHGLRVGVLVVVVVVMRGWYSCDEVLGLVVVVVIVVVVMGGGRRVRDVGVVSEWVGVEEDKVGGRRRRWSVGVWDVAGGVH